MEVFQSFENLFEDRSDANLIENSVLTIPRAHTMFDDVKQRTCKQTSKSGLMEYEIKLKEWMVSLQKKLVYF